MPQANKIRWLWNRLSVMSGAEVLFRARRTAQARLEAMGVGVVRQVPPPAAPTRGGDWLPRPQADAFAADGYAAAARRILAGHWPVFALDDADLGPLPNWNRDPRTGRTAPLVFGKTLDYRDPSKVGDIKYLWEPNRHLQLVTVAQAYALTGDGFFLTGLAGQLDSWLRQCPYLMGPNWTSSLELGIRLINWALVWQLAGGWSSPLFAGPAGEDLRRRWLESIFQHAHFIQGHFSRHSSANNHLIGEATGLFIATITWPFWDRCRQWQALAHGILVEEAVRQNWPDGVNKEQAVSYQQFVLDFLVLALLAGTACGVTFPPAYRAIIERMLEYLAAIMDVAGHLPMLGDADDGYAVRLSQEAGFCPYRSLLATGAVLFDRPDLAARARIFDDKSRWLLGAKAAARFRTLASTPAPAGPGRTFASGGYYLLGLDLGTGQEVRCLVDCGPLGYLSIAAHGHADALALCLSVAGREILVDPGTFAYHTQKAWRNYFRGTGAHNTVRIDGLDQSEIGGSFLWLRKARATCEVWQPGDDADLFAGNHDGYQRLADPVLHRRQVVLDKKAREIVVTDTLECRGQHIVERFWHLAEGCEVSRDDGGVLVQNGPVRVALAASDAGELILRRGEEKPPCGWVSRSFDRKVPSTALGMLNSVIGTTTLVTRLRILSW
ncbi:MAG: alginate lyase family protein [Thermodesulfobacteriota bacterium]